MGGLVRLAEMVCCRVRECGRGAVRVKSRKCESRESGSRKKGTCSEI